MAGRWPSDNRASICRLSASSEAQEASHRTAARACSRTMYSSSILGVLGHVRPARALVRHDGRIDGTEAPIRLPDRPAVVNRGVVRPFHLESPAAPFPDELDLGLSARARCCGATWTSWPASLTVRAGPGGRWRGGEGHGAPGGVHVAWQPPHFRLPARHGWGRLAHGPATRWVAEPSIGPALRPPRSRSSARGRRAARAGVRSRGTWTGLGIRRRRTGSLLAAPSCKILIVLRGGVAEPG